MNTIIQAADIQKSYQMGRETLHVLKGVSVEIEAGSFSAITGASGSGKSTLLHILGALDRADEGTVQFEGKPLNEFSGGRPESPMSPVLRGRFP